MRAPDFIETARHLTSSTGRPRQTDLRRAVSTTYYALFHCLAACYADTIVGGPGAKRSKPAWRQAYRALNHGSAKQWKVERFFAWLQWQRRIVTRWEYYPTSFLGFVQLAFLLILFKRF